MKILTFLFALLISGIALSAKSKRTTDSGLFYIRPDTVIVPATSQDTLPSTIDVPPQTSSPRLKAGDLAPAINAESLRGRTFSPDFMKEKTAVLFFWKPDAATTSDILGGLNTLSGIYARVRTVVFLSMAKGEIDEVKSFLENNLILAHNTVKYGNAIEAFAITEFPTLVVVDKNGKIIFYQKIIDNSFAGDVNKLIDSSL